MAIAILMSTALMAAAAPSGSIVGTWGGDRMMVTVTPTGATLKTDCAEGTIEAPVAIRSDGSFSSVGTFTRYHPGPQRADATPPDRSAAFTGHLSGADGMTLIVHPQGGEESRYTLRRNARVKLVRCL